MLPTIAAPPRDCTASVPDVRALKAFKIKPVSTSPKAIARYRNLAITALKARGHDKKAIDDGAGEIIEDERDALNLPLDPGSMFEAGFEIENTSVESVTI